MHLDADMWIRLFRFGRCLSEEIMMTTTHTFDSVWVGAKAMSFNKHLSITAEIANRSIHRRMGYFSVNYPRA
jgi:hypothetical protein